MRLVAGTSSQLPGKDPTARVGTRLFVLRSRLVSPVSDDRLRGFTEGRMQFRVNVSA